VSETQLTRIIKFIFLATILLSNQPTHRVRVVVMISGCSFAVQEVTHSTPLEVTSLMFLESCREPTLQDTIPVIFDSCCIWSATLPHSCFHFPSTFFSIFLIFLLLSSFPAYFSFLRGGCFFLKCFLRRRLQGFLELGVVFFLQLNLYHNSCRWTKYTMLAIRT
jgi:hypothetical protein